MLFSILIPTLEERAVQFQRISGKLRRQIAEQNLEGEVELLAFPDKRRHSVGLKRNRLIVFREKGGVFLLQTMMMTWFAYIYSGVGLILGILAFLTTRRKISNTGFY